MPLLNYTTQIDADKSIAEMQKMLALRGAQAMMINYEDGIISALSFQMKVAGQSIAFKLPCDWRPVLEVMKNDKKVPRSKCTQIQAVKVAWRIVKDWVAAQMALVDTKMVRVEEVFLAYAMTKDGRTLGEKIMTDPGFLLGSGKKSDNSQDAEVVD